MPKLLYVRDPNQRATVDERGTSPRATLKFELSLFLAQGRASPTEKPTLRSC